MTPAVLFVTGGGMTADQAATLGQQIQAYYQAHIPSVKFTVQHLQWTDDIAAAVNAVPAGQAVILMGHSYGAHAALQALAKVGRVVEHMILCDPVDDVGNDYQVPNTAGFAISPAGVVAECVCFYRGATEAPYSGYITSPNGTTTRNILLPPSGGGSAAHHGDSVWDSQCWGFLTTALQGGNMLPNTPPAPPVPTPPVPPPPSKPSVIKVLTVTVMSDGTATVA